MTTFKFSKQNGKVEVVSPYNSEFVKRARNLRGSWNAQKSAWVFDESVEEHVKNAMKECFGVTGEEPVEFCTLHVKDFTAYVYRDQVDLFGRTIARAFGRDSGAKLGDDIIWLKGKYTSGGSVKNWSTDVENAEFEIQNFPVERTKFEDVQKAVEEGWCEIIYNKKKRTREEIEAEIAKYRELIAELENELNNL